MALFQCLNDTKLRYALETNNGDKLPDRLPDGKDIDILVEPDDCDRLMEAMLRAGFCRVAPFLGKENGYRFAYGLQQNLTFLKNISGMRLYIDVDTALMCLSLQPKIWIPLDKTITRKAFENRVFNKALNCWELDDETRLIYLLARAVFNKKKFSDIYIDEIEKRKELLDHPSVISSLEKIFFRFTPELIRLLKSGSYSKIRTRYILFEDY